VSPFALHLSAATASPSKLGLHSTASTPAQNRNLYPELLLSSPGPLGVGAWAPQFDSPMSYRPEFQGGHAPASLGAQHSPLFFVARSSENSPPGARANQAASDLQITCAAEASANAQCSQANRKESPVVADGKENTAPLNAELVSSPLQDAAGMGKLGKFTCPFSSDACNPCRKPPFALSSRSAIRRHVMACAQERMPALRSLGYGQSAPDASWRAFALLVLLLSLT